MVRNCIAIVAGALLVLLLDFGATNLIAFVMLRNRDSLNNHQLLMQLTLWGTLAVGPAVAVIVGAFFAWLAQRRFWWLVGGAFVPGLIYVLVTHFDSVDILGFMLFAGNVALAYIAAFVISRLKQPRAA